MATPSSLLSAAMRRLEGKVALITGGASGIGEVTARLFSKNGAKVVIADIQDDLGYSVCKELETAPSYVHCDVTNEQHVENAVNTAVSKYGKLDIMFNNAGITGINKTSILENQRHEFEKVLNVNVVGGVSSHAYTSSKHAVVGFTKSTAVEFGPIGIRVNCISPYIVASTPLARDFFKFDENGGIDVYNNLKGSNLEPIDVAEAALYLGSDASKFVSGHNLVVDGGFTVLNAGFCIYDQSA
ncbi:hypothetical protein PIB30_056466 [Stylosanthes scabra]|uniref:Secoisolariciresinol dehydrogenase-like n=1 Tax=Stylosanthes scabra TaxID=79078 RepID=A0ABU6YGT6_9FABA|nr:hypothetical protein [Stylosanthes scabra]